MRKAFALVLFIAVLIAFFRSDLLDDLLYGEDMGVTNWFDNLSVAAEERVMRHFREDVEPLFTPLDPHQIEYAQRVMKDRQTLRVFHLRYCLGDDKNPYIYGATLLAFCTKIQETDILRSV